MKYVIFTSYGNDSIALVQWAYESGLDEVTTLYHDTGWARDDWPARVASCEEWVRSLGYEAEQTTSMGLEALARSRKGWPRQGIQFCTEELKIGPAQRWLEERDPDKIVCCMTGVRREESLNRKDFPLYREDSPAHHGRACWAPLVHMTEAQRDDLLLDAGFAPLPHRSMECFPCINSNRDDLLLLAEDETRINKIELIETDMGFTSKGKPRTMFRPYRYMGATGIREIVRWAQSERGKFSVDDGTGGGGCDAGFCGV